MTRADIIQIIFGIHSDEMDAMKNLSRKVCGNDNGCMDCEHNEHGEHYTDSLCPVFWTTALGEDEWDDCVQRFTILHNTHCLGYNRGYLEGEKRTVKYYNELKKEVKEDE